MAAVASKVLLFSAEYSDHFLMYGVFLAFRVILSYRVILFIVPVARVCPGGAREESRHVREGGNESHHGLVSGNPQDHEQVLRDVSELRER